MVANVGKVLSGDWAYVEQDIRAVCAEAHRHQAIVKVILSPKVQVKAAGGVRDLDGLIRVRDLGGSRCGATATAAMLDELRRRAAAGSATVGVATASSGQIGKGGY